jgi:hypothetical protein
MTHEPAVPALIIVDTGTVANRRFRRWTMKRQTDPDRGPSLGRRLARALGTRVVPVIAMMTFFSACGGADSGARDSAGGCADAGVERHTLPDHRICFGEREPLGMGHARTFVALADDRSPERIGIIFDREVLEGLPETPNSYSRCYDANGDGAHGSGECLGDYEIVLPLPEEVAEDEGIPFEWTTMSWNPLGHGEPYTAPHFDFHFYLQPLEEVRAIRTGPCHEFIDCEDLVRATVPVPEEFMPAGYLRGASVAAMGTHYVSERAPELLGEPFTHTWIYGSYEGHVSFYEPMITHAFLSGEPAVCTPIDLPVAWERSGYYPTEYCIRSYQRMLTVSFEKLVYRSGVASERTGM